MSERATRRGPTPGPWRYGRGEWVGYVESAEERPIAVVSEKHNHRRTEANGLLLAAAWDLLEACRAARRKLDDFIGVYDTNGHILTVLDAAIKKATEAAE